MLQLIRDKAHGWLAWVIVLLITVPFALWGIQEYLDKDPNIRVATINGVDLNLPQFQRAYGQQKAYWQGLLDGDLDISLNEEELKRQTLERLIEGELLAQTAARNGLRISDSQVARAIHGQAAFRQDGKFSEESYVGWLRRQGYGPGAFEQELRRSLIVAQIFSGIAESAIVTKRDSQELSRLVGQRRSYASLVVPVERYHSDIEVSEADIETYYGAHRAEFVTPQRISLEYVELSRTGIADTVKVTEDELRRAYQTETQRYVMPEQRRASHVLVAVAADADESTVAAARQRAEKLRQKIVDGADFETLAKQVSDDAGSRSSGGDLGFFSPGDMDKVFEDAAYSMAVGEISMPVRSKYGFHLIKVTGVRPGKISPFEQVRAEILRHYKEQKAESIFFEQAEKLANLAFEHPDSLEMAAQTLGLEVKETGLFDRNGRPDDKIAGNNKVLEAAFSQEVLEQGNNSEVIDIDGDQAVVLRVKEHRPSAQLPLADAHSDIVETIKAQRAQTRATRLGEALILRLRAGEDRQQLAAEFNLKWEATTALTREDAAAEPIIRDTVFRMPRPAAGRVSYDGAVAKSGDFVILALESVTESGFVSADSQHRESMRRALQRDHGQEEFDALVRNLHSQAKVSVYRDNL